MHASVRAAWPAFCSRFEGRCWWMYLDTKRLVTTGIGFLIDDGNLKPPASALAMSWKDLDGKPASRDQITAEWKRVKGRTDLAPKGGFAFRESARLRLPEVDIDALLFQTTGRFWTALSNRWHDIEEWPADAQLAALDLAWQNGPAFTDRNWPNMRAAFAAQDWPRAGAAVPGTHTRAKRRKQLFANAAKVAQLGLDAAVLWDQKTPSKPEQEDDMPMTPAERAALITDIAKEVRKGLADEIAAAVLHKDGLIKNVFTGNPANTHVTIPTALEHIGKAVIK